MWKCANCAKENNDNRIDCWSCSIAKDDDVAVVSPISSELNAAKKEEWKRTIDIWGQKSDEELIIASENLSKYRVEAEEIIRAELRKRGISEPEPTVRTIEDEQPVLIGESKQAQALSNRYWDAYFVAKVTIGLGKTIKMIGFILATIILLGTFAFANLAAGQRGVGNDFFGGVFIVALTIGGTYAFIVGFVFYVIGVIVSAQGQILTATLDNTVGNSPFLRDELKAKIMSLPKA